MNIHDRDRAVARLKHATRIVDEVHPKASGQARATLIQAVLLGITIDDLSEVLGVVSQSLEIGL